MSILRVSFLLFVFSFTFSVKAQQTASDLFVDFVIESLEVSGQVEEFEQIMGSDWIDEIALYAASWNSTNALHFLNILKEASIEPKYILKILQAGSYLQALQADHLHFEFQVTGEVVDHISSQSTEVEFPEQLRFPEFAFLNTVPTNEISGHDVLIQFVNAARQYLGATDFDRIMGSSWDQSVWERRLIRYMREGGWTRLDARNFVLFLIERIGLEGVLKRIKNNASYFDKIELLD